MRFRIKERREELGMTMTQLAEASGVSEATISRWESGDVANMRRNNILALAKALKVTPDYIMGWDEDEEQQMPAYYAAPEMERLAEAIYKNTTLRYMVEYAIDLSKSDLLHVMELCKSLSKKKTEL